MKQMMKAVASAKWMVPTVLCALFLASPGQAQLILGGPAADGSLKVRESEGEDDLVFEIDPTGVPVVRFGSLLGGTTDTDIQIVDVLGGDLAFSSNSSQSNFEISSQANANDGDLGIYDGVGNRVLDFDGASGYLDLGASGEDGDLGVRSGSGTTTIRLDGDSGDVTQALGSQGLIKAWCKVSSSGNIVAGWRCDSAAYVGGGGFYTADFTSLSTDVSSRPVLVSVNEYTSNHYCDADVNSTDLSGLRIACTGQVGFVLMIF